RPAALRDIMDFPADISSAETVADFDRILGKQNLYGNNNYLIRGLKATQTGATTFSIGFTENSSEARLDQLAWHLKKRFADTEFSLAVAGDALTVNVADAGSLLAGYLSSIQPARDPLALADV